jgi:hypothetical protein
MWYRRAFLMSYATLHYCYISNKPKIQTGPLAQNISVQNCSYKLSTNDLGSL